MRGPNDARGRSLAWLALLLCAAVSGAAALPIEATDGAGNAIRLDQPLSRAVVIRSACMMPEVLAAFGSPEILAQGLCMRFGEDDLLLKIAPSYKSLQPLFPNAGLVNLEEVISARPQAAFISSDLKNAAALRSAGIVPIVVNSTTPDVREIYRMTGDLLNKGERAQALVDYADSIYRIIEGRVSALPPAARKTALYVQSTSPLSAMGKGSYNEYMTGLAGGRYVVEDVSGSFVELSIERLLKSDPDFIFVSPKDEKSRQDILSRPEWASMRAVKAGNVYRCPLGAFFWDKPSAESPLYALWMAGVFYPDLFPRSELEERTRVFFRTFFSYSLTDKELRKIFN